MELVTIKAILLVIGGIMAYTGLKVRSGRLLFGGLLVTAGYVL